MHKCMDNKFTQQYEEFKRIPQEDRLKYYKQILQIPLEDSDFKFQEFPPTYFYEMPVPPEKPQFHITLYIWQPISKPKAILFFIHGINGYAGSMSYFADYIRSLNNILVVGIDCRNFGRSGGNVRGLLPHPQELISDAEEAIKWALIKYNYPDLKIFLAGLSMGGAICLNLAVRKKYPYSGVIFFSPALVKTPISRFNLTWKHYLQMTFMPQSSLFPPSYSTGFKYKKFIDKVKANPYIYNGDMRAGTLKNVQTLFAISRPLFKSFDLPYLFVQSGVDKSVDPFQIRDFERESASEEKTHFFVKDAWHSICFDQSIYEVVPQVSTWLKLNI